MATMRNLLARLVTLSGFVAGAASGAATLCLMWPEEMNRWEMKHLGANFLIAVLVGLAIALPILWLADRIDPTL
jgi:hypothetical protein